MNRQRERLLSAALEVVRQSNWSGLTMAKVAQTAGVSRQSVYNEIGGRAGLAQSLVGHQLQSYVAHVQESFAAHPHDVRRALESAILLILQKARGDVLIHAVSSDPGAQAELLPLLTSGSQPWLDVGTRAALELLRPLAPRRSEHELVVLLENLSRLVMSYILTPTGSAHDVAAELALWAELRLTSPLPAPRI